MDNKKSEVILIAINLIFIAVIIIFNIVTAPPLTKSKLTFDTYTKSTEQTSFTQLQTSILTQNEQSSNTTLNINKASFEELQTLPQIGQVKAQAIVDYRNANGDFMSVDDLINVEGIGQVTLEKIKPYISIY